MGDQCVGKSPNDKSDTTENACPAEYLFKNTKYHDCHLKVGDPNTGEVEVIGVVTSNLVAHSSVFRHMLVDSDLADPTGANTHITDVRPEVFRLMLKYMYGGCLGQIGDISKHTVLELALCADKYNVQPLVGKACCLLTPKNVEEVFLSLQCVVHVNNKILEECVIGIIQEQTDKVVGSKQFLTLDPNALEFIAKQDKLSITELKLWQSLVQWVKSQDLSEVGARQLLAKPLRHVRLATLAKDQIIDHVLPANVLTPSEVVNLLKASSDDHSLGATGLCVIREKRGFCVRKRLIDVASVLKDINKKTFNFNAGLYSDLKVSPVVSYNELLSDLSLKIGNKSIEIVSITIEGIQNFEKKTPVFSFQCMLSVYKIVNGFNTQKEIIAVKGEVAYNEQITFPLQLANGLPLTLDANTVFKIMLEFSTPQLVYKVKYPNHYFPVNVDHFHIKFTAPFHVTNIAYKL